LLELTGFSYKLTVQAPSTVLGLRLIFVLIPVVALVIALGLLQLFSLTPQKMAQIRAELEARRGTV